MRKLSIVVFAVAIVVLMSGCIRDNRRKVQITKNFFDSSISYHLDPGASVYMSRIDRLLTYIHQQQELPDEILGSIYRGADGDQDHIITLEEAKIFYLGFVGEFEDSLKRPKAKILSPK